MVYTENRAFIWLRRITTAASALYAGGLLVLLMIARLSTSPTVSVDWNVAESPQFLIALLLVTATASLWILRNNVRLAVVLLFVGGILVALYDWAQSTLRIKANTGPTGTNWLSNTLIGVTWYDGLGLVAMLSLVALLAAALRQRVGSREHDLRLRTSGHH